MNSYLPAPRASAGAAAGAAHQLIERTNANSDRFSLYLSVSDSSDELFYVNSLNFRIRFYYS